MEGVRMKEDPYVTNDRKGRNWRLLLGDACERLAEIESDAIDLSICSPPFASLYTYSPSLRDLGNSSSRAEFIEHYGFIIREQLRVTKPGRMACIHVQQLTTRKSVDGYMGVTDFRGQVIQAFLDGGWHFYGEVTVWKNPQCLKDGTPVLTPSGWQPIDTLDVGDQVIGSDGLPTKVIDIPFRGQQPVCRVTFSDGDTIDCGPEHLWTVRTSPHAPWHTLRTDQLLGAYRHEIPTVEHWRSNRRTSHRYVASVERVNATAPMTCISVSNDDGLFVADGYVVTHNSQAIRTKAHPLMFVTKNRDSAQSRPALADYLLLFRKPGDNAVPIKNDVSNEEWIDWAAPIWEDKHDGGWITDDGNLSPVWYGIKETDTLNIRVARENADERHICPLQLPFIERCIRLWSNPGELILTPFAGIGSEVYMAVKLGRKGIGIELKPKYWKTAVDNMIQLEKDKQLMREAALRKAAATREQRKRAREAVPR